VGAINQKNMYGGIKMKKKITRKALMVLTVAAVVGFGTYAFADWGMGYGRHDRSHHGYGQGTGGYGGSGHGYMMGDLSKDQIEQMDEQRKTFFKQTENLKQEIYEKELAMKSEFAKKNLDAKKVASLQKEISKLKAQIDHERIEHMIEIREINPNVGRGSFRGGPMRYGSFRGDSCWR
jgi:Spy/CpxP family protein refolding chaperone